MKLSKLMWSGITLIATGATAFGCWAFWPQTAINEPINMPISMTVGHVLTPEFKVNVNRLYTIRIVAKKTIPFDTLNCLLGMSQPAPKTCEQSSVIKANWTLTGDGTTIAQGTSENDSGGAWAADNVARQIGSFRSQKGRSYVIDVNLLTDGTVLSATDPHLKVEVSTDYYEGSMWTGLILIWFCAALVTAGTLLIGASAFRSWLTARKHRPSSLAYKAITEVRLAPWQQHPP